MKGKLRKVEKYDTAVQFDLVKLMGAIEQIHFEGTTRQHP